VSACMISRFPMYGFYPIKSILICCAFNLPSSFSTLTGTRDPSPYPTPFYDKLFFSSTKLEMLLMGLFLSVILPIMAVFASGFILQRIRVLDVKSVSAVSLYILSPALVFVTLYEAEYDSGFLVILIYMFVLFY